MQPPPHGHDPVLLAETLDALKLSGNPGSNNDAVVIDCTTGRGGHSQEIAARLGSGGTLICLDADPANLAYARDRIGQVSCRTHFFHANFSEITAVLHSVGKTAANAILADLGLSTNQLLDPNYGLSFSADGPLDMRIDPRSRETAEHIVNRWDERDLADMIYQLSDERFSRRIARKIVESRRVRPIRTTGELADLVRSAIPPIRSGAGRAEARIDPATRTFMALRMQVNGETANLARLLEIAPRHLATGGRMAVISFHSVEDRMVKQAFRSAEQTGLVRVVTKKPLTPSDTETAANPRARSAKLRVAERTELPSAG